MSELEKWIGRSFLLMAVLMTFSLALLIIGWLCTPVDAAGIWNRNDAEITGNWTFGPNTTTRFNGPINGSDATFSGTVLFDSTRSFSLPLVGAFIYGEGVIGNDGTTAPGIATTDNVPAIVWADDEVTPVQWTFRVPADYSSGMAFRILCSESDDTTPSEVDWQLYVNSDGFVFDAAAIPQTAVALTASSATNEEVTLTPDATGAAAIAAGSWVTLDIFNTTTGGGTLEVKGVEAYYTSIH